MKKKAILTAAKNNAIRNEVHTKDAIVRMLEELTDSCRSSDGLKIIFEPNNDLLKRLCDKYGIAIEKLEFAPFCTIKSVRCNYRPSTKHEYKIVSRCYEIDFCEYVDYEIDGERWKIPIWRRLPKQDDYDDYDNPLTSLMVDIAKEIVKKTKESRDLKADGNDYHYRDKVEEVIKRYHLPVDDIMPWMITNARVISDRIHVYLQYDGCVEGRMSASYDSCDNEIKVCTHFVAARARV